MRSTHPSSHKKIIHKYHPVQNHKHSHQLRKSKVQSKINVQFFNPQHVYLQNKCQNLIAKDRKVDQQLLFSQINKAIQDQITRLYHLTGIKIGLSHHHKTVTNKYETTNRALFDLLSVFQDQKKSQNSFKLQDKSSSYHDQESNLHCPDLKRMDSSRLLCDNYQNNDLIYSVQVLTPKLPNQQMDGLLKNFQ